MGRLLFVPDSAPVQETGNLKVFADDDYAPAVSPIIASNAAATFAWKSDSIS